MLGRPYGVCTYLCLMSQTLSWGVCLPGLLFIHATPHTPAEKGSRGSSVFVSLPLVMLQVHYLSGHCTAQARQECA